MGRLDDNPAMRHAELDPRGAVSVYGKVRIPTGRKKRRMKGYSGFGDLDPANSKLIKLLSGDLSVEELDDEELGYGIPKCDDGKFSIKAAYDAAQIPQRIQAKMQKELIRRASLKMGGNVLAAIDRIVEIATSPSSDDKDAFKAADWLVGRVMGKVPDVVKHTQEKPFEVLIDNIARGSRSESRAARAGEVVEGTFREVEAPQWKPPPSPQEVPETISRERRS